jgi:hypothetical protein
LAATTFLALVDERLAALHQEHDRLNSVDGIATTASQIAEYEGLRRRIEDFLEANAQFLSGSGDENQIVEATTSFAQGVRNWWDREHVSICSKAFDRISFGAALGVCSLAGAGGPLSAVAAGSLVVGKPFAECLTAWAKAFGGEK